MTYQPHPMRIQRMRTKGWRMPEGAAYVGRPGVCGNPFRHADPAYAVKAFRLYAMAALGLSDDFGFIGPRWANVHNALPMEIRIGTTYSQGENDGRRKPFLFSPTPGFEEPLTMVQCPDLPRLRRAINELRGKLLACWCPLDRPCHADVLAELANQ